MTATPMPALKSAVTISGEHVDPSGEGGGRSVACRTIPLDTLSSHGLALKTNKAFSFQHVGHFDEDIPAHRGCLSSKAYHKSPCPDPR